MKVEMVHHILWMIGQKLHPILQIDHKINDGKDNNNKVMQLILPIQVQMGGNRFEDHLILCTIWSLIMMLTEEKKRKKKEKRKKSHINQR